MTEEEYKASILAYLLGTLAAESDVSYDAMLEVAAARGWVEPGQFQFRGEVPPGGHEAWQRHLREQWLRWHVELGGEEE